MMIKKIEKKSEAVEAAVEKNSAHVAKNAAELGSNLRKTDSEKVTVINGLKITEINRQLVMDKDMEFKGYLIVKGDIVGKDGKIYGLKVNGNLYVTGSLYVRHLDVRGKTEVDGNIDVWGNIYAKDDIISGGKIRASGIDLWGKISARNLYILDENIRRHGVERLLNFIRRYRIG